MPDVKSRPVRASRTVLSDLMSPPDANIRGTVFGGKILAMVDKAAAVSATRHAKAPCVTIAMERVEFLVPIQVGDWVLVEAQVNFVGRSSMEIGVEVYAENLERGDRRHTNSCLVTMVALDKKGRPAPVPALTLETPDEKTRHAAALLRREARRKR
ncbi:MAG: acyl-CoA thioesterase [Elusimicrobia bacterium]|nr:acyl-CoA thioesterase [Elusimicrobiota bacterium]